MTARRCGARDRSGYCADGVAEFDGTLYPNRPVTERARKLYMDWAATQA